MICMKRRGGRVVASGLTIIVGIVGMATVMPVQAQDKPHKNIVQRHPTASSAVAGIAAHHYAKTRKHGFMHRHPIATGVAAAAVTHHYAKKKHKLH